MLSGSNPRKRRHSKKDVDHISNLPDTILCYLLSFLTTKSAVKTSILSKRWKYVWTKVPALDFTDVLNISGYIWLPLDQKICFKRFMDNVLLHNDASYVQRFCLQNFYFDAFFVNSWLNAASRREMHELNISFGQYLDVPLPPRFLLSEKLVVLKLHGSISIGPSMSFHLPNLETIHLTNLKLPNDEFMKNLSSSCLVLRELHIVSCDVNGTTLCVESLALKSLLMKYTRTIHGLQKARIVIKTPNLSYLCLQEYEVSSIDIEDMTSLVEADLDFGQLDSNQVEELFKNVYGVKTLRVRSKDCLRHVKNIPVFPNLTWLKYEADSFLSSETLNCAPKLKWLFLPYHEFSDFFNPEAAPEHLPCLETVEICGFTGLAKELNTAAYFLRAASALKEMKITFSIVRTCDVTSAYQRLLDLPRSSAVCRIKITN